MQNFGVMLRRVLIDSRWGMLWWGLGIGLFSLYIIVLYPYLIGIEGFATLMESPMFQAIVPNTAEANFATPEGFLGMFFFTWTPLLLAVYAVINATGMVAGEEAEGTFDILLSTPTPRWQVIVEKSLGFAIIMIVVVFVALAFLLIGASTSPDVDVPMGPLFLATVLTLPIVFLIGALSLFLATILPTRAAAGGIAAAFLAASYFINTFAGLVEEGIFTLIQKLSFYSYYNPMRIMQEGVVWGDLAVLIGLTALFFGLAVYFFERKDIAV